MLPASPAGAAADLPDAIELSPELAETADVAATAPPPTLRKSRRVVFIPTPPASVKCEIKCFLPRQVLESDFFDLQHQRRPISAKRNDFIPPGTHGSPIPLF